MSRVLFLMLHPGFVRYYDDAIRGLAAAGHRVHVAFEVSRTKLGEDVTAQRLATWSDAITCGPTPTRVEGVKTTVPFHQQHLAHERFRAGDVNTRFVHDVLGF